MVENIVLVGVALFVLGLTLATTRLAALWLNARRTGWWQVLLALILAWIVSILAAVGAGIGMAFIPASLDLPEPVLVTGLVVAVLLPTLIAFALALGTNLIRAFGIGFLSYVMSTVLVALVIVVLPILGLGGALGLDALVGLAREEMTAAGVRMGPPAASQQAAGSGEATLDDLWERADAVCGCKDHADDGASVEACVDRETSRFVALQAELLTEAAGRGDTDAIEEIELATQRADPCMIRRAVRVDAPPREMTLEEVQAETEALCECVARHPPGSGPRQTCVSRFARPFSLPDDPEVVRLANEAMERAQRCMSGIAEPEPEPTPVAQPESQPESTESAPAAVSPRPPGRSARALAAAYHWRSLEPGDAGSALFELVWVTDAAGEEYKGLLMEVRAGTLVLKRAAADGGDMKQIPVDQVRSLKVFEKRG